QPAYAVLVVSRLEHQRGECVRLLDDVDVLALQILDDGGDVALVFVHRFDVGTDVAVLAVALLDQHQLRAPAPFAHYDFIGRRSLDRAQLYRLVQLAGGEYRRSELRNLRRRERLARLFDVGRDLIERNELVRHGDAPMAARRREIAR